MTDNNSPPESPNENPDQNSEANPLPKDDSSLETIVQRFQDSISLAKRQMFWETQPVVQFKDVGDTSLPEGPIEPPTPLSEVKQEPYNLPSPYEWTTCELGRDLWALLPPGYYKNWHVGVRDKASKKLVAFITGVPARIRAAYTAGVVLPTPITTCQFWHRSLNPKKLMDVGFSRLGARMTMSQTIQLYKLPDSPATPGFRKMELRDVPAVTSLLRNYLSQFVVSPDFDENDVEHWLLPPEDVMDSYLVESPETHEVTDFCSFYTLPSSILGNQNYSILKAAYSYYNVSTKTPLLQLMNDALIVAKQKDFDVFNALDVMQNESFLKELKFGPGNGLLRYYLYNYRIRNALRSFELGLVLL
ncbi:hypothetical protein CRYUN_Cryun33cG0067000 [Craigia yunnanensis]